LGKLGRRGREDRGQKKAHGGKLKAQGEEEKIVGGEKLCLIDLVCYVCRWFERGPSFQEIQR